MWRVENKSINLYQVVPFRDRLLRSLSEWWMFLPSKHELKPERYIHNPGHIIDCTYYTFTGSLVKGVIRRICYTYMCTYITWKTCLCKSTLCGSCRGYCCMVLCDQPLNRRHFSFTSHLSFSRRGWRTCNKPATFATAIHIPHTLAQEAHETGTMVQALNVIAVLFSHHFCLLSHCTPWRLD